jgi:hypothetical protein
LVTVCVFLPASVLRPLQKQKNKVVCVAKTYVNHIVPIIPLSPKTLNPQNFKHGFPSLNLLVLDFRTLCHLFEEVNGLGLREGGTLHVRTSPHGNLAMTTCESRAKARARVGADDGDESMMTDTTYP